MPIRDVDYNKESEWEAQIVWAEFIMRALAPEEDLSTLRIYVEWLDQPEPGVTDRSWYE